MFSLALEFMIASGSARLSHMSLIHMTLGHIFFVTGPAGSAREIFRPTLFPQLSELFFSPFHEASATHSAGSISDLFVSSVQSRWQFLALVCLGASRGHHLLILQLVSDFL